MSTYLIKNERVIFKIGYNPNFINDVKLITGRCWNGEDKTWDAPINFTTSPQINNLIKTYNLTQEIESQADVVVFDDIESAVQQLVPTIEESVISLNLLLTPRPYQVRGIAYNLITQRCINGSDMGTGKTFTSIFTVEVGNLFPCICIVPAFVKYNWEKQWKRTNPNRSISIIEKATDDFTADVLIISYNSLGLKTDVEIKGIRKEVILFKFEQLETITFKSAIMDESQYLKSNKTVRSKAVRKLTKKIDNRFMATGTAIMNRPKELIQPLTILDQFTCNFNNWQDFVYQYCAATQTRYGIDYNGASNTLELNQKLRACCYFRVEKRDVLQDLPPLEETILDVDIDNEAEYKHAEKDLVGFLEENYGRMKADKALYAEQLVLISTLSQLATKGKITALKEWIDMFLDSSTEKLVVFGIHTEHIKELARYYKCDCIIGGITDKKKQKIVDEFQVNDKRLLFLNLLSGGVGVDGLQNICSTVLIYEFPWRWTDIEQAYSRIERDGVKNHISVYYMRAHNTIDEKIWNDVLLPKRAITDAVNKGEDVEDTKVLKKLMQSYM